MVLYESPVPFSGSFGPGIHAKVITWLCQNDLRNRVPVAVPAYQAPGLEDGSGAGSNDRRHHEIWDRSGCPSLVDYVERYLRSPTALGTNRIMDHHISQTV